MIAAVVVVTAALAVAAFFFLRRDTGYKVDEFARARSLTTEWARSAGSERRFAQDGADANSGREGDRPTA